MNSNGFNLSRRRFGFGAAALAGSVMLPASAFAQDAATRSVTTSLGTYDIPADPQRVICIDSRLDLEPAVALGLSVIGHAYWQPEPWVPADPNWVFVGEIPDLEKVLALEPDLIICTDVGDLDSDYWPINRLKDVAPVLPPAYTQPWKEILAQIGEWTGRKGEADAKLAEYDALIAEIKARHGDKIATKKVVAAQPNADGVFYLQAELSYMQPQVLADLGAKTFPIDIAREVSAENVGQAFADVDAILLVNHNEGHVEALETNTIWKRLPAVEAGAVIAPLGNTNFGGIYTAIQVAKFFDELYGKLA